MRQRLLAASSSFLTRHVTRSLAEIRFLPFAIRTMASEAQPISAEPADKQIIVHNGKRYQTVKEGLAHILVPAPEEAAASSSSGNGPADVQQVFYNPIQQFNRDLTVLALKAYGKSRLEQKQAKTQHRKSKSADKRKRKRDSQEAGEDGPPEKNLKFEDGAAEDPAQVSAQLESGVTAGDRHATGLVESGEATDLGGQEHTPPADSHTAMVPKVPSFTVLDALSASGLRALRYAHEIPFLTSVTSNDIGKSAVESIKLNVEHNRLESKIKISHDDALAHMYDVIVKELRRASNIEKPSAKSEKYDVIDLDPYGTAAPFFDAAVQAVRDDGGLLCVTCTDSGVWASAGYPEKCYSLYGGIPVKGYHSHEAGIRIILHGLATSASRYGLAITPLMSLSVDFYIRVFVTVKRSPALVKFEGGKNMVVYSCDQGCGAWTTQLLMRNKEAPNKKGTAVFFKHGMAAAPTAEKDCEHCGSRMHLSGPMYAGRIHSPAFIQSILDELDDAPTSIYGTTERIRGMLHTALEEIMPTPAEKSATATGSDASPEEKAAPKGQTEQQAEMAAIDPYPFYVHPSHLSGVLHCITPPDNAFRGALVGLGYRTTRSHCKPGTVKTDAPWSVVWRVMREWVRQKAPVKEQNIKPGSAAYRLLGLGKKQDEAEKNGNGEDQKPKDSSPAAEPKVVFDESLGRHKPDGVKLVRYQMNPRENWGPMNRATGQ